MVRDQYAATNERDFARAMRTTTLTSSWSCRLGTSIRAHTRVATPWRAWFGDWFTSFDRDARFDVNEMTELDDSTVLLVADHHARGRQQWRRGSRDSRVALQLSPGKDSPRRGACEAWRGPQSRGAGGVGDVAGERGDRPRALRRLAARRDGPRQGLILRLSMVESATLPGAASAVWRRGGRALHARALPSTGSEISFEPQRVHRRGRRRSSSSPAWSGRASRAASRSRAVGRTCGRCADGKAAEHGRISPTVPKPSKPWGWRSRVQPSAIAVLLPTAGEVEGLRRTPQVASQAAYVGHGLVHPALRQDLLTWYCSGS